MPALEALWVAVLNGTWKSSLVIVTAWVLLRVLCARLPVTRCAVWSLSALSVVPLTLAPLVWRPEWALLPAPAVLEPSGGLAAAQPSPLATAAGIVPMAVWAGGALAALTWLAAGAVRVSRLRREARPVQPGHDPKLPTRGKDSRTYRCVGLAFRRLLREMGAREDVDLLLHPGLESPAVVGVWRPAIILPGGFPDSLDIEDLRLVLAHELAHVRRRDGVANLVERLVGAVFWMSPLHAWAFRRARQAREEACDEWVVTTTGDRRGYAKCLLNVAAGAGRNPGILAAQALLHNPSLTTRRIEYMLRNQTRPVTRLPALSGGAIALAAVLLLPAASRSDLVSAPTATAPQAAAAQAVATAVRQPLSTAASQNSVAREPSPGTSVALAAASSRSKATTRTEARPAVVRPAAASTSGSATPPDVPADHWAAEAVAKLYELGIMEGYPAKGSLEADGKRRPRGLLSETELRKHLPPDVPVDHWAAEAVAYLFELGVLEGYPGGTFNRPRQPVASPRRKAPFADVPFA